MQSDIGALLVEAGLISEQQLQHVLTTAVQYGGTLIANLIRLGYIGEMELASFLSSKLKLPMAERAQFDNLPAFITRLVSNDTVMAHRLIPIMLHQGVLHMALADPTDRAALEEIAFATGYKASPVVARHTLIEEAMARYYEIPPDAKTLPPEAFTLPTEPQDEPPPPEDDPEQTLPTAFSRMLDPLPAESVEEPLPEEEPPPEDEPPPEEEPPPEDEPPPEEEPLPEDEPPPEDEPVWITSQEAREAGLEQAQKRLEVVEKAEDDLEELFFGLGGEDRGVVHLTRKKGAELPKSGTITDAIRSQAGMEVPPEEHESKSALESTPFRARAEVETRRVEYEVDSLVEEQMQTPEPTPEAPPPQPEEIEEEPSPEIEFEPLADNEDARSLIDEAGDRDEVARILVRFALAFIPRIAMFIVKKDIMVGWMGAGEGITNRQIKGIMIPLNSPSVFKTVRETGTDYFGSLPKTTINDVFISALGDVHPRQILLVPVTVRHKPICILYGDCGVSPGFSKDLSPVHLLLTDVSQALERIILEAKMSRRVVK
jgi:hypothetical protein